MALHVVKQNHAYKIITIETGRVYDGDQIILGVIQDRDHPVDDFNADIVFLDRSRGIYGAIHFDDNADYLDAYNCHDWLKLEIMSEYNSGRYKIATPAQVNIAKSLLLNS